VKRDRLLNELLLIVIPQPGAGNVFIHLRINSGSMFDLAGKAGLADLTAAMLLKSASGLSGKDASELVSQLGLIVSVEAGYDSTDIAISGPAAELESILDLLGRMVINPRFEQAAVESEKAGYIRLISGFKEPPLTVAKETALATLYGRYPLGHPNRGTVESIPKITRDDLAYFHDRFYLANDSELVVEGDVLPEEVTKLARSKLGAWKKGEKVPATFLPPDPVTSRRIVIVDSPESSTVNIAIAGHGISRRSSDYLACSVLAQLLESSVARSTAGAAYKLMVRFEARYLAGPLVVDFDSPADKTATAIQAVIDAMEHLKAAAIPQEELDRAKQGVSSSYSRDVATGQGFLTALLDIERYGLGRDYMLNFEARVGAVTAEEVRTAAQNHLNPSALAISVVGPGASLSDSLKKLGQVSLVSAKPAL
jgi:zinc protease